MTYVCQVFPSPLFDLILQICLLDLLWIRPLISLDVYCGLLLVGNAIKCYLKLLAVCFVRALLSSCFFILDQLCLLDIQRELMPLHQKLLLWLHQPSPLVRSHEIHPVLPWLLVLSGEQINSPAPHHYRLTSGTNWRLGLYRR